MEHGTGWGSWNSYAVETDHTFQSTCPIPIPAEVNRSCRCSTHSQYVLFYFILFYVSHSGRQVVVSQCSFNLDFPDDESVWAPLIYLLPHVHPSFWSACSKLLSIFLWVCLFLIHLWEFFIYSGNESLLDACVENIFLLLCDLDFQSLMVFW